MKKYTTALNLLLALTLYTGCSEKKEATLEDKETEYRAFADSRYIVYKMETESSNQQLTINLFDSIAFSTLDLILEKRAYEENPDSRPSLKGYGLDAMEQQLVEKNPNIDSVKKYILRLKGLREHLFGDIQSKSDFIKATDTLLDTPMYRDSILKKSDSIYTQHIATLKAGLVNFKEQFKEIAPKKQWQNNNAEELKAEHHEQFTASNGKDVSFLDQLKEKSLLLFWLLAGSMLLNTVLCILLFRKRKVEKIANKTLYKATPPTLGNQQETIKITPVVNLPEKEVAHLVTSEFEQFKKSLEKRFHKDCVATQDTPLNALKLELLNDSKDQKFKDADTLKSFIEKFVSAKKSAFEENIEKFVPNTVARQRFDQALDSESIVNDTVFNLISPDEIRTKVNQFKRNYLEELLGAIRKTDLDQDIIRIKKEIDAFIDRRVKENSQMYFPFADANGMVSDDKKSKEQERESAIKLTLHPNDTTKASFQLLYDYKEMMLGGIQSYDVLLMPICNLKAENFNRNGTKIQQLGDDGEMELLDGKWNVSKKLDIKII